MTHVWINDGSGWNAALIEFQYINISTYRPLSGRFFINLPVEFGNSKKAVINIEKRNQKYFLWYDVGHINLSKKHPERIKTMIKKLLKNSTMMKLSFHCKKKILTRLR